ncbi:hypothetical protein IE53DRAFT_58711 [Violaceomyces palustris]|uniref:Uncharacterized protein n=1 Tax=Violaceomyces palustris TaxID=1673888 RepID=A0ACD0NZG6_9BASI|nr:hypothetical protein IE53DRAFT_58711 [Violaceomyces palustris]
MSAVHVPTPATFDEAHQTKVDALLKEFQKTEIEIMKHELKLTEPLFKKRAEIVADVKDFWFQALVNCMATNVYIDDVDHEALSHLSNITVERDLEDPRAASVTFEFRENPYFTNASLTKKFTLAPDAVSLEDDFNFVEHTVPEKTEIDWKSDDKNLVKLKPTVGGQSGDEEFEPGSFFSTFFDNTNKEGGIGHTIIAEFYPKAIEFYMGETDDADIYDMEDFSDDDEEDEEDDDDDDREIDLEAEDERPSKKAKSNK